MQSFAIDYAGTPFLQTSQTNPNPVRLNWRCEMLLTRNRELLREQRVLDLASHDGRFSYACLSLGARSVTGIEGRPHLVQHARENLEKLGFDESRFRFEAGDIFDWLPRFDPGSFDVIVCFGFLYHTIRQVEFFQQMDRLAPKYLIVDSNVEPFRAWGLVKLLKFVHRLRVQHLAPSRMASLWRSLDSERDILSFQIEDSSAEGSTIDRSGLTAFPTPGLFETLMRINGFEPRRIPWERAGIDDFTALNGYDTGLRASWVAERRS